MAQVFLFFIFISSFHFFIHSLCIFIVGIHMPFGEVLTQKRTKKVKTSIFADQLSFYSQKD